MHVCTRKVENQGLFLTTLAHLCKERIAKSPHPMRLPKHWQDEVSAQASFVLR